MPYIKIWIHLIWATKNRYPFLNKSIKAKVVSHIRENAKDKKIHCGRISTVFE
ncbi:transposase [candidate division KSB1 bacterium]|nr:transposase [candidate division KSB1 bacterium]